MTDNDQKDGLDGIESVITDSMRFKAKLAIGEDAYTSLKLKNSIFEAWDTAGVGITAAGAASTFLAPSGLSGLLVAVGIGATPIGWVIAAGVLSSGAWYGITRFNKDATSNRVTVIPKFINTPIDVLGLGLFNLMAPLALKVADVDGYIDEAEMEHINTYFVNEWGYDQTFVTEGLAFLEAKLSEFSIKELAQKLAKFKIDNPDCNYEPMAQELLSLLTNIMEVDGKIDEREEMAIEKVRSIFKEANQISLEKAVSTMKGGWSSVKDAASNIIPDGAIPGRNKS